MVKINLSKKERSFIMELLETSKKNYIHTMKSYGSLESTLDEKVEKTYGKLLRKLKHDK